MQQYQKPVLVQEQRLKMSPQMFQSIQLMALPLQELTFRIHEELEKNPALELLEDKSLISIDEYSKEKSEDKDIYFENSSDPGFIRHEGKEASDRKQNFLEGALSRPESLQEHLMAQLAVQNLSEDQFETGELIIHNLNSNGFFQEDPNLLLNIEQQKILPEILDIIHSFDPLGICVKDYKESLLVQADLSFETPEGTVQIIENYLPLVKKNDIKELTKKLNLSSEEIIKIIDFIQTLNPYPGRLYSRTPPSYVIPDIMVTIKNGEFVLVLNDEEIPVLGISPFFEESQHNKQDKETRHYINNSIRDARWFINSIHLRNQTLIKIATVIVEFQRNFFIKGPKYLLPLTLKDVAEEVKVHETTVSRISNAKYMQTEWGIYPIKYFFTNSISGAGSTGSRFSKEGVKATIKELLTENISAKKLSDQKISDLLKLQGIKIARRTVAKYRSELLIDSSFER
ncbi:MAG: RNA polymerase factor sigma-54 [Spirochaetia bacterium]|jgi:RNA polymerase sigma-54 factor|nr:RNA polymerase factor sigma-54 [Spirochaetia bacterium]